jgi:hypothetical protein
MAQRLEAALRRPNPPKADPARPPRTETPVGRKPALPEASGPGAKASVKSPETSPDLKLLSAKGKNEVTLDSLEDEMAKMLGRPGKS